MVTSPSARLAIAGEHVRHGRLDAAEATVESVLAEAPDHTAAQTFLAALRLRAGRLEEAAKLLASVREREPRQLDAIGLLAVVRKAQGDFYDAARLFQTLVDAGVGTVDVHNQIGECWLRLDDAVAAGIAFKRAIELDRTVAHSVYNLGMALRLAGRSYETFATFKRAIELDSGFHEGYVRLWEQMRELLNWKEGLPYLEDGLRRHPGSVQMRVMLAMTYGKVGRRDRAEALYREATAMDPAAGPPYAHWLQEEGRFEESVPMLQEAVRANPVQGLAYYNLVVAKCFEVEGALIAERVRPLLDGEDLGEEERMFLHYALAKVHEGAKEYGPAMAQYDAANEKAYRLYNEGSDHDAPAEEAEHATLTGLYTKETIEKLAARGSESRVPIFIVGMIRTGTTLLDQILSSHPRVKSSGEQPFWGISAGRINRRWVESGVDAADLRDLERRYLQGLRDATGGATRITDKMPTNFAHIGLMSVTFPTAKFIHIRRSPLDTCLSIYTTFLGRGTGFAYSQANIVGYYRAYLRTMEHWRSVLPPGRMIEIDYEDLVSDKEAVLRELLEFLDLPWDDALLSHHERRDSQVSTPSLWTARQPVNAGSVERWRRYEPWLGQLLELRDVTHPPRVRAPQGT